MLTILFSHQIRPQSFGDGNEAETNERSGGAGGGDVAG